jgi:hypothetical protein
VVVVQVAMLIEVFPLWLVQQILVVVVVEIRLAMVLLVDLVLLLFVTQFKGNINGTLRKSK